MASRGRIVGITIGAIALSGLVANVLFLKNSTIGIVTTLASFVVWGYLLSRFLPGKNHLAGDSLLGVYVIVMSLALVGGLAGLLGFFGMWLSPGMLVGWAIVISFLVLRQPADRERNFRQAWRLPATSLVLLVAFGITLALAFSTLLNVRTGRELLSPWQAIPSLFWLQVIVAFSFLWIVIKRILMPVSLRLFAIILFGLLFYLLIGIVYRYGYGVDIFLLQAHEKDLVASGSIGGNQIAFIHPGFESLVAGVWAMIGLSPDLSLPMVIFLAPVLSAFLVPYFTFRMGSALWDHEIGLELALGSLALPATFFVTYEVARVLAGVLVLGQVLFCSQLRTGRSWLVCCLAFGVAIFLVHPLIGLIGFAALIVPAVGKLGMSRWRFVRLLPGTLAFPLLLGTIVANDILQRTSGISLQLSGSHLSLAALADLSRNLAVVLIPVNGSMENVIGTYYIFAVPVVLGYLAYTVLWPRLVKRNETPGSVLAILTWNVIVATMAVYLGLFFVTNPPILSPHYYLLLQPIAGFVCLPWLGGLSKHGR